MFGIGLPELLIFAIVGLLLFGKHLLITMRRRGFVFFDKRWEDNDVMFLKVIIMALVALLCYFIVNSQ